MNKSWFGYKKGVFPIVWVGSEHFYRPPAFLSSSCPYATLNRIVKSTLCPDFRAILNIFDGLTKFVDFMCRLNALFTDRQTSVVFVWIILNRNLSKSPDIFV